MDEELERMLALGVIEKSNSSWSTPLVGVRKPNSKLILSQKDKEKTALTVPGRGYTNLKDYLLGYMGQLRHQSLCIAVLGYDLEPSVFLYLDDIVIAIDYLQPVSSAALLNCLQ